MDILITILAFLILVGIVVTVHEGGHFFTALACKIRIVEFSIGFGPKIFQKRVGKDNILFTLRALPLGGFVKPLDESTVSKEEWEAYSEEDKKRTFMNAPRWKKALMVFGGPASNFILAFFIFFVAFSFIGSKGLPAVVGEILPNTIMATSELKEGNVITEINGKKINFIGDAHAIIANSTINGTNLSITTEDHKTYNVDFKKLNLQELGDDLGKLTGLYFQGPLGEIKIKSLTENGAAEKAGLKEGDIITAINGVHTQDLNKMLRLIKKHPNEEVLIEYIRDEQTYMKKIVLDSKYNSGVLVGKLGVEFKLPEEQYKTVHYGIVEGFEESFDRVISSTITTVVSIGKMITGEISTKAISGPLSIADYSGKSAQKGLYTYLMMMAAISIAVGVFNLLPVPLLDGGHLVQYAIEGIRNKDFTIKQIQKFQYVGIAAMTGMFTLAIVNDLTKYLGFLG